MGQQIYFNNDSDRKRSFLKFSTKLFRVLAPKSSMVFARKMLLTPKRRKDNWVSEVKKFNIKTEQGAINCYSKGNGPVILFIHGWSGSASQFEPLMDRLSKTGYKTISFDLPAHGSSEGTQSSLPNMIKAFDSIVSQLDEQPVQIVCHSMGASVMANSKWFKQFSGNTLLIAPLLKTYDLLKRTVEATGFDSHLFNSVVDEVGVNEQMTVPSLDAETHFVKSDSKIDIVHDTKDPFAPIEESRSLSKFVNIDLTEVKESGHGRVINHSSVFHLISENNVQQVH